MTLTTRLSLFFLTMLALVLIGFSVTLYLLARAHLLGQSEERLDAVLNTLVAAVEFGKEGVEWEPEQRHLNLGPAALDDQVAWIIRDHHARVIDRSQPVVLADHLLDPSSHGQWIKSQGATWLVCRRVVDAPPMTNHAELQADGQDARKYPSLAIVAAVSLHSAQATLQRLALTLVSLSLGIWLLAMFTGRAVCRRALLPVTHMALAMRDMDGVDLHRRLPAISTGDELESLQEAFNSLLRRVQESFERQKRFTGDASHQLRTPLAAILGQIEVALRRDRPTEEYQRVLHTVQRRADHLRQIVESLLFLARADAEAPLPTLQKLDLVAWLEDQTRNLADHARRADIRLDCGELHSAWVVVAPDLLGELLHILVDNACKFSKPGTSIEICLHQQSDQVTLSVQDHGQGIAASDLSRIFTPFFRAEACRRQGIEGVGLGLSIGKRLANACGGPLTATSEPGQGSCFSVCFPIASEAPLVDT